MHFINVLLHFVAILFESSAGRQILHGICAVVPSMGQKETRHVGVLLSLMSRVVRTTQVQKQRPV